MEGGTAVQLHGLAFQTASQATLRVSINQRILTPYFPKKNTFFFIANTIAIHFKTIIVQSNSVTHMLSNLFNSLLNSRVHI